MTVFYWAGGSGDLGVVGNWRTQNSGGTLVVPATLPGSGDTAETDLAGTLLGDLTAQQMDINAAVSINGATSLGTYAFIGNSAAGSVAVNGGSWDETGTLDIGNTAAGALSVSGGGVVDVGQKVNIGETSGATGTLIVTSGTFATPGTYDELGNLAGAQGTATIEGSGSRWNLDSGSDLAVGNYGTGDLLVAAGGFVQFDGGPPSVDDDDLDIGLYQDAVGTVTVNEATLDAGLGAVGVGLGGTGSLLVESGGTVLASASAYGTGSYAFFVGYALSGSATGSGVVTLDGAGSVLEADGIVGIADSEAGTLTISNGATVEATAAEPNNYGNVYVGVSVGASGTISIDSGAVLDAGPAAIWVGGSGNGTLIVQGGTVLASNTGYDDTQAALVLGWELGATPSLHGTGDVTVDGAGSLIKSDGPIWVGQVGSGTLTVSSDATVESPVTSEPQGSADILVGVSNGATGAVTVTSGALLSAGAGGMWVGLSGNGNVLVQAGGTLTTQTGTYTDGAPLSLIIGSSLDGTSQFGSGAVTVDGVGSLLKATAQIDVGDNEAGTLVASNSADIQVIGTLPNYYPGLSISPFQGGAGSVTVETGATLDTGKNGIAVGLSGSGTLTVAQGGTILAANSAYTNEPALEIGASEGSTPSIHGSGVVTVTGAGSLIRADGPVEVGELGTGTLVITDQGTVEVTAASPNGTANFILGDVTPSARGSVLVSSGGLLDTGDGRLAVGDYGTGTLAVTQGGTVLASAASYTDSEPALRLGYAAGASGYVTLDDATSTIDAAGQAVIGNAGSGTLVVSDGAVMTVGGTNDGSTGLILDAGGGIGTVQVNAGTLLVSDSAQINGESNLAAINGGTVGIAGNVTLSGNAGLLADDTARIEIGSGSGIGAGTIAVDAGHTLAGSGFVGPAGASSVGSFLANDGVVDVSGGTMGILGAVTGAGAITVEQGAELEAFQSVAAGQTLTLDVGSTLLIRQSGTVGAQTFSFLGTLDLAAGDETIAVDGLVTADGVTVENGNTLAFDVTLNGTATAETIAVAGLAAGVTPTVAGSDIVIPCYVAGTRIATDHGEVAVERLRPGDLVRALSGRGARFKPVRWIGTARIDLARHPHPERVAPVRVRANAFADGTPWRDLLLSPDHAVFVDGALIPVRLLLNGATIVQEAPLGRVAYYHVELDSHDVLLAEGLAAESYLDTGNRAAFANGGAVSALHPDFAARTWDERGCAPLLLNGARVAAECARLRARAAMLGYTLTADPDLRVSADGTALTPLANGPGRWRFHLPGRVHRLRLVSRVIVPEHLDRRRDDRRRLGIALTAIALDGHVVALADPLLESGFHPPEGDGATAWRWTDGDAILRIPRWRAARMLELHVADWARYWAAPVPREEQRQVYAQPA